MSVFDKVIPKELLALCDVLSNWFNNSGIREKLDQNGTTGINYFKTCINGRDAIVALAVSYLNEEQTSKIDEIVASTLEGAE